MKFGNSRRLMGAAGAVLALSLAAGAMSLAAEGSPEPQSQSQTQAAPGQNPGASNGDRRSYRLERRLDYLHERLEIRPSQDAAWRNFAATLQQEAATRRERFRDAFRNGDRRLDPPTAIERLERRQNLLTGMRDSLGRVLGAMRPLYAALDDDQKRAADQLFARAGLMDRAGGRGFRQRGDFFDRRGPGPDGGFYR
jgi:small-conductance mechanosensitive channel